MTLSLISYQSSEVEAASEKWDLVQNMLTFHVAQGQTYWNTHAPNVGLPATTGAFNTATSFLTDLRDAAWEKVMAEMNRMRTA